MEGGRLERLERSEVVEFANREIDRHVDTWKHFDQQLLGLGTPFIGLSAATLPILAVVSTSVDDPRRFYLACIPLFLLLAAGGTLVATRYMRGLELAYVSLIRADLMRRFFVERAPELADYTLCSLASADVGAYFGGLPRQRRGRSFAYMVVGICALLVGAATSLTLWGIAESAAPGVLIPVGGASLAVTLRLELAYLGHRQRETARFLAELAGLSPVSPSA